MPLDVFGKPVGIPLGPNYGPGMEPTFGESFAAAFNAVGGTLRDLRVSNEQSDVVQRWIDDFQKTSGFAPDNPEYSPFAADRAAGYAAMNKAYEGELRKRPDLALPPPPTEQESRAAAIEAERKRQAEAATVAGRPQTFLSGLGGTLGSIAGVSTDPINLASMAATGGAGGILMTGLRIAAIAGVSQAAISGLSYGVNKEIDPNYGIGDAASEIGQAAVGGFVFGGLVKALGVAWARLKDGRAKIAPTAESPPAASPESPAAPAAAPDRTADLPQYVRDAGNVVERQAGIADASPYKSAGVEGETAHAGTYKQAEAAVTAGKPVEIPQDQLTLGTWRPGKVTTADGKEVGVKYEVVEADTLVASQRDDLSANPDYPAAIQPRDRTRAASAEQIAAISGKLDPKRLGESPDAAYGAPIVGPDNVVESGNGRTLGIRRAYVTGQAEAYRNYLKASGFDVDGMRSPVLIARRTSVLSEAERADFAASANRASVMRMSAPEQALADARLIDSPLIEKLASGDVGSADNRAFVKAFLGKLPKEERGGMVDRGGALSNEGIRRVEAALLARAYGEPALLSRILESPDSNIKALGGALTDSAGRWTAMRDAVSRGDIPAGMDITPDLLDALRLVAKARDERVKLAMLVDQAEMFAAPSPITRALLRLMFRDEDMTRPASRPAVVRGLDAYAEEAAKNTTDARLFGEPLSEGDVLATALAKAGREDLAPAAEQAVLPLKAREAMIEPDADDAAIHQVEHLLAATAGPAPEPKIGGRSGDLLRAIGAFLRQETELKTRATPDGTAIMLNGKTLATVNGAVSQETALEAMGRELRDALQSEGKKLNSDPLAMSLDEFTVAYKFRGLVPQFEIGGAELGTVVKTNSDGTFRVDIRHLFDKFRQENAPPIMVADPSGLTDAAGNPVMRPVKELLDEADAEIAAAKEIEACATGNMAEAAE